MEPWYTTQEFFSEEKLAKIKSWMQNELIDLSSFTSYHVA